MMKYKWSREQRFLTLPIQNNIEYSEIRYYIDGKEYGVRRLPLARTRVDTWLCIDLFPLNAQESIGIEIGVDNMWTRRISSSAIRNQACQNLEEIYPIIHLSHRGKVACIYGLFHGADGLWNMQILKHILGESDDYIDSVTLESRDLLDWRIRTIDYNLPIPKKEILQKTPDIWGGTIKQEFITPYSNGKLTLAIGGDMGVSESTIFSIPLELREDELIPIESLRKLRVWERQWKDIRTCNFDQGFSFRIAPGLWPNIRILEPEGKSDDISARAFEIVMHLEAEPDQRIDLAICGFSFRIFGQRIWSEGYSIPAINKAGSLQLTIFLDQVVAEVICGKQAIFIQRKSPIKNTINVDNTVSGNVGGCTLEIEPDREVHIHSERVFNLNSFTVYGLRASRYSLQAQRLIDAMDHNSPLFYQGKTYSVYGNCVSDANYGHPDAYVYADNLVISPVRVKEEFQWRDNQWGDMVRAVNRKEIWRPAYDHSDYPRLYTAYPSLNASYAIALDIFAACKSEEFALPGQAGMWSAGLFQGHGEGFGVWTRDSAHIAIRSGNLLDRYGARKTLLYTTRNGFDNGADGPAMAIVGLWDYYLATHDRFALDEAWPFLYEKMKQVESRFSEERGLVSAAQSTSNDAFDEPENDGYCLSTECYFMKSYSDMARIGALLGFDREAVERWRFRANRMRESINKQYWNEKYGYYTSGPRGSRSYDEGFWETSGSESVIWSKFLIADERRRQSILKCLRSTAMTDYGIELFPYRSDKNHFCGSVWVVWEAGFADAAASQRDVDLIRQLIGQQIRNCIINKTFYEVIDARSGIAWRWPGQLWHAAGFVSIILYGLFGIRYDERGVRFEPAVPVELANSRLEGLQYGEAVLDIIIEGHGTDFDLLLDGEKVTGIPWEIYGRHQISLKMK